MKIIYFFFIFLFLPNVFGFGISPAKFDINLNNNDYIEKEFFILNDKDSTRKFNVSSYGFEYFNFTELILDIGGNSEKDVIFRINVPYETVSGNYEGRIYIKEILENNGGLNVDNLLGVKINLIVDSDYLEESVKINTEQKNNEKKSDFGIKENLEIEVILFYFLIVIIFVLCFYKILICLKK